jgi:hypothetical protein
MAITTVTCNSSTLGLGDSASVVVGYVGDTGLIQRGYVKSIERMIPDNTYKITINDVMTRAVDFFIANADSDDAYIIDHVLAENLIGDVLGFAGITNYGYQSTSFTFGINSEVPVDLISSYDFCKEIADILAWHLYADTAGKIWFIDRKPYIMAGDSSIGTLTDTSIVTAAYTVSERDLRNRIVARGTEGVHAEASAVSPFLPAGFYKTVVIATDYLDVTSNAQLACNYNLALLNRLTESMQLTVLGNHIYLAREIITVNSTALGLNCDWYIYGAEHNWGENGYLVNLELRR